MTIKRIVVMQDDNTALYTFNYIYSDNESCIIISLLII